MNYLSSNKFNTHIIKSVKYVLLLSAILITFFFGFDILILNAQSPKTTYSWSLVTANADFFPRDGAGTIIYDNKIWLMGGWNGDSVPTRNSQVWNSTDGVNWTLINPDAPWPERHCAGWIVFQNKLWLVGGDGEVDVWNTTDGITWDLITDNAPWGPRYKPYILLFHDTIWLMGGFDYFDGNYQTYNDVWYSVDGANWVLANGNCPWEPRGIIHGKVIFDGKVWILGGGLYGNPDPHNETYYNDIWCSSDCINWTEVNSNPPWVPRLHHNVAVFDNKIWVMDGHNRNYNIPIYGYLRNDVWYSSDGISWTELTNTPWTPTHAASTFIWDSCLYLAAGYLRNEVWKLESTTSTETFENFAANLHTIVYPNPVVDKLNIELTYWPSNLAKTTLQIVNIKGESILLEEFTLFGKKNISLDVADWAEGIYIIIVNSGDKNNINKFIINH